MQESGAEARLAALRTETETAAEAERPRGRDWLAAHRLFLSRRDSKNVPLSFLGLTESIVNLPRAEIHCKTTPPQPHFLIFSVMIIIRVLMSEIYYADLRVKTSALHKCIY